MKICICSFKIFYFIKLIVGHIFHNLVIFFFYCNSIFFIDKFDDFFDVLSPFLRLQLPQHLFSLKFSGNSARCENIECYTFLQKCSIQQHGRFWTFRYTSLELTLNFCWLCQKMMQLLRRPMMPVDWQLFQV